MKCIRYRQGPQHGDVGRQIPIAAEQPGALRSLYFGVEMQNLVFSMHAGIGATTGSHAYRRIRHLAQRPLHPVLDIADVRLALPAVVSRTVILDASSPTHS